MEKLLLSQLPVFARDVLAEIESVPLKNSAFVLALLGDLGAGKTTFTQALARELGVTETLQSPTYVLMKSYAVTGSRFEKLVHIDAYRLNSAEEFAALKPEQFLQDPKALVVIEWPERVEAALSKADLTVRFSSENAAEGERSVLVEK
jgi:tRNA threonylcarbamoyladenosine biosynthesis protein TsaE